MDLLPSLFTCSYVRTCTYANIPECVVTVTGSLAGPSSIVTACIVHSYVVNGFIPVTVPLVLVPVTLA